MVRASVQIFHIILKPGQTRPDPTESKTQREREDQRGAGGSIIVKLYL